MFFWLKKLIGYWLMPVPACVLLLAIGTVLLFRPRWARAGRIVIAVTAVGVALLANKLVSIGLVRSLETRYAPIPELTGTVPAPLAACRFVVVLGAGNGSTPGVAALNVLSTSARARVAEAVRVMRQLPQATLLVSGPAVPGYPSHATVLEKSAISLGIAAERIERIEHARDTEEEALAVKRRAGDAPVVLVTSAWHMPRSVALFRAAGVNVVPCPTDYASQSDGRFHWTDLFWDVESLQRSTLGLRERIGYLWITLRGKTDTP